MKQPLPYSADLETVPDDEARTIEELQETLAGILQTTALDYGHAVRSVHAKSHGLLKAELGSKPIDFTPFA